MTGLLRTSARRKPSCWTPRDKHYRTESRRLVLSTDVALAHEELNSVNDHWDVAQRPELRQESAGTPRTLELDPDLERVTGDPRLPHVLRHRLRGCGSVPVAQESAWTGSEAAPAPSPVSPEWPMAMIPTGWPCRRSDSGTMPRQPARSTFPPMRSRRRSARRRRLGSLTGVDEQAPISTVVNERAASARTDVDIAALSVGPVSPASNGWVRFRRLRRDIGAMACGLVRWKTRFRCGTPTRSWA